MADLVPQTFYKEKIKITLYVNPDTKKAEGIKIDVAEMTKTRLLNCAEIFTALAEKGEPMEGNGYGQ